MNGLHSGKQGGLNAKPLLAEKIENGYLYVKVSMMGTRTKMWKRKQAYVWEQAHGKIPKGYKILFLDNNRQNCDLENLVLVSCEEHMRLSQYRLRFANREFTLAGIAIVRHSIAIHDCLKQTLGSKEYKRYTNRRHQEQKRLAEGQLEA